MKKSLESLRSASIRQSAAKGRALADLSEQDLDRVAGGSTCVIWEWPYRYVHISYPPEV